MLSQKAIKDFKKIWKDEFGRDISIAEAEEQGTRLLKFFELLIEIDQKKKIIR